jgi:hypothetical protein
MAMYGRRPLTRLEAGLYAGLVGIFITVFAWQILDYMELAERSAMNATLSNLASGLNARAAQELLSRGKLDASWARRNPFEIAQVSGGNYVGSVDAEGLRSLPSASWAFDPARAEVVYLPRRTARLETSDPQRLLRFRLVRSPRGPGYVLEPTATYRWE